MNKLIFYFLIAFAALSCTNNRPDVSAIEVDASINRFDRDVFSLDTLNMEKGLSHLSEKYGKYWNMYNIGILGTGNPSSPGFIEYMSRFICDKNIREVYDSCAIIFADMSQQENELEMALKYMKYYFPESKTPKFYTHISGFNQSIAVDSALISVSIDNYMGENCKFYNMLSTPVPMYARASMSKERIPLDILKAMALTGFSFKSKKNNLVSNMLYHAKILYFLSQVFPDRDEAFISAYSEEDLSWCKANEANAWAYIIEKDLLYSSDHFIISKYTNDAPFTSGMPAESPARVANWLGLQIIKSYMKTSKHSLKELMNNNNYEAILRESSYQAD
jgi:hypothetical protein